MKDSELDAVVDRLKTWIPEGEEVERFGEFNVEPFPDDIERFDFYSRDKDLVVSYERSTFESPTSNQPISQREEVNFAVTVLVRSLRGRMGAGEVLADVRRALVGWRGPWGGGPVFAYRADFVDQQHGTWRFVQILRFHRPLVSDTFVQRTGPAHTQTGIHHQECDQA